MAICGKHLLIGQPKILSPDANSLPGALLPAPGRRSSADALQAAVRSF
jgi:hypothetical protein